jgi:subtilisin family serine protease
MSGMAVASAAPAGVTSTPNDVAFRNHQQWGLAQAGFPTAWCRSTGAGALIVVIDTGVDAGHPDLAAKLVGQARVQNGTLTTGPGTALDDAGHGTHVAGIATAVTGNGIGIAGAAPDARLFAIKVLFAPAPGHPEQGTQADLVQAIDFAADTLAPAWSGPVVLNISIGAADASASDSGTVAGTGDIAAALDHAYARGLAVAVAAGNIGTSPVAAAAVADGSALSVGALDQNGMVAPYSPTSGVSVFAAGGAASGGQRYISTGIISTWPHSSAGDYAWMAGTSMAAPHVAAALALLMSTGLSNRQAYAQLLGTEDAQRRMHVDVALRSTAPCGVPPAVRPRPVVRAAAPPPAAVPPAPVVTAAPTPVPVAAAVVRRLVVPTAGSAAPASARGSAWESHAALGVGAVLLLVLLTPRRRLLLRLFRA